MKSGLFNALLLAAPALLSAQTPLALRATPVHDDVLAEILNDGEMQDLNKLNSAKGKDVSLRLYSIAHSGTCVEETEWVCSYRYVLAVSEFGDGQHVAIAANPLGLLDTRTRVGDREQTQRHILPFSRVELV